MKNNKLIAEFMGLTTEVFNSGNLNYYFKEFNSGTWYEEHELSYNTSWDWLMPVVEKIECTKTDDEDNSDRFFNVMIEVFECNINGRDICICENGNTKLEATYRAVVKFINQYNFNESIEEFEEVSIFDFLIDINK
jgi:hypothetical protein